MARIFPTETVLRQAARDTVMRGHSATIGDVLPRVDLNAEADRKARRTAAPRGKGPRKPGARETASELRRNRPVYSETRRPRPFGVYE